MNAYTVDWRLLLEFVKAAGPFVAVLGIYLTARMGLRNFREQKLLERRLDWYEAMARGLLEVSVPRQDANVTMTERARVLIETAGQAQFYADKEGMAAAGRLLQVFHDLAKGKIQPADHESVLLQACKETRIALAREIRKDLRLRDINLHWGHSKVGDN